MKLEKLTLLALSNGVVEKLEKGEPVVEIEEPELRGLDGPPGLDVVVSNGVRADVVKVVEDVLTGALVPESVNVEDRTDEDEEDTAVGPPGNVELEKVEKEEGTCVSDCAPPSHHAAGPAQWRGRWRTAGVTRGTSACVMYRSAVRR